MVRVELDDDEWAGADRGLAERVVGERLDRHAAQQVGRRDRLGRQLEKAAERRREVESNRPLIDRRWRHLEP